MRRTRGPRGQSLVEFALILPLLLITLLGIVDMSRGIYTYNALANAAREAVRTAIINQDTQTIADKAAQQATAVGLPRTALADANCALRESTESRLWTDGTCVEFKGSNGTSPCPSLVVGCTAIVSVKVEFRAITPLIANILGPIPLTATSRQAVENVCPRAGWTTKNDCLR